MFSTRRRLRSLAVLVGGLQTSCATDHAHANHGAGVRNAIVDGAAPDGTAVGAGTGGAPGSGGGVSRGGSPNNDGAAATGGISGSGAGDAASTAIKVTVTPATAHVPPGGTVKFVAAVGSSDTGVVWTATGGSVDASGLYTAPSTADTYVVTATSKAEGAAKGTANVFVAQPRSCANLPAAGTWENISPPGATETQAVVVDPFDSATVWVGVTNNGIHKSSDCGATWTHVNTGRNGAVLDTGAPGSIEVDPMNRGVLYSTSFDGADGLFKSTNGGVDWDQMFPDGSEVKKVVEYNLINSVAMDVHDSNHVVASMHANCSVPYGPVCLAVTHDAGTTWKIVTADVGTTGWVAGAGAFILDENTWIFGTYYNGIWLTEDDGKTFKNITPQGDSGSTAGKVLNQLFAPSPAGNYYLPDMSGILMSKDGRKWSLLPNSGGRSVGFTMGGGRLYSSDQWSPSFHVASETDLSTWTKMDPPSALPNNQGGVYLMYDNAHHLLYASTWTGGLWRIVTP